MECGVICYLNGCKVCIPCMDEYIFIFILYLVLLQFPQLE